MRRTLPIFLVMSLLSFYTTFSQEVKPIEALTDQQKEEKALHQKMENLAKERFPEHFKKSIQNPLPSSELSSTALRSSSEVVTEGFTGAYLMQQLDTLPANESLAGAFNAGFIFPTAEVFIMDEGDGRRSINAEYINFGSFRDYYFTVTSDGTVFEDDQSTGFQCNIGITLGMADDSLGTIDIANDSIFYLRVKDNQSMDCDLGAFDAEFIFVRQADRPDLAVLDVTRPNDVFLGEEIRPEVYVSNFGNNIQDGFDLSYSVDGVEIASQFFDTQIMPGQGVFVTFDTPFDFSSAGSYTIEAVVSIAEDVDTSNDAYAEVVESYEPISTFPYMEDFEEGSYPLGYDGGWQIASGATSPARTGPSGDNTNGDGFYMVATTDGNAFSRVFLNTRAIDLSELSLPALTFHYHMFGTLTGSLSVNVIDEIGITYEMLTIEGEQQSSANANYNTARVNLARFQGQQITLQFTASSSAGISSDIAIDDLEVSEGVAHDLALTEVREPFRATSGVGNFSVVVYNPGASAEASFDISAYVNGALVATEVFEDVLLSGNSSVFEFDATYDFSAAGRYEIAFEVDLPADEFEDNDRINSVTLNNLPWTGIYQLEQDSATTDGPSGAFSNGIVFGSDLINTVTLEYIDDTTRAMSLAYLEPFGTPLKSFTISFGGDELIFDQDQGGGIGCVDDIVLGTSGLAGFFDADSDAFGSFYLVEDVLNGCGAGSPDVLFSLSKKVENDLQLSSINLADVIPTAEHFINFTVTNTGVYEQLSFDASFYINDEFIAIEEFSRSIFSDQSASFTFEIPHSFLAIDTYSVKVEISGANDADDSNNSLEKVIQTSGYVINATPISGGRIGIEWNDLTDADSYVLERVEDSTFVEVASLGSDTNFYVDVDVEGSMSYEYRLKAMLSDGTTSYSDVAFASPSIDGTYQFEKVLGDITGIDLPNWSYGNAWGDLDDDGDLDMIVSNVPNFDGTLFLDDEPYVYLNDGNGRFEKIEDNNLVLDGTSTRSTAIIDFNNDGLKDVFMPQLNASTEDLDDRLFENNGALNFQRVEAEAFSKNHSNEQSVWGDMDNDGDLDLFIAGSFFPIRDNFLFVNNGDGTFESITEGAIYEEMYDSRVFAWTASWVDFDNDGDQDLYVPSNVTEGFDGAGARMFRNLGAGEFEVVTNNILVDDIYSVRGAHWADVDQDGWMDLIMIPVNGAPIFYFNDGDENFTKVESADVFGEELNIHRISTIGDLDNNGKQELIFASNGFFVYESNNDRTFTRVDNAFPPIMGGVFAGMSLADMDGDGDLDLFRGNGGSGYAHNVLYENKGNANNWLHVNLTGEFSNADGIGAKVVVYTEDIAQYRTINPISGLISQGSLTAEFGLGTYAVADSVKIYWPSGTLKELYDVAINQIIEVDDSNAPTDVGVSNSSIPEGLDSGSPIGASFSVDLDGQEDGHTYEITGGGDGAGGIAGGFNIYRQQQGPITNNKFSPVNFSREEISSTTEILASADADNFFIENGTIKSSASFDFESQSSYSIQVRTTDSFGNTFDKVLEIEILDVNEEIENNAPSDITLSNKEIAENESIGTVLGVLESTDLDEEDTHTYSLVDGDANIFSIDGDLLLIAESFDFEREEEYALTIRSIDNNGKSVDKEFTIKVENVNEEPLEVELDNLEVDEEQVSGTFVGNLFTDDTDNNDEHSYAISGEDASFFQIVGDELLTAQSLDFEDQAAYDIIITSTDAGGLEISEEYTITVNDVNDAPSAITLSENTIEENLVEGLFIGELATTDDDVEDSHSYSLSGVDASSFQIVLNELRTGAEFDFESKSLYEISVISTDENGLSLAEDFTISILDENDAPTDLGISSMDVVEAQPAGLLVGSLFVSDDDVDDTHTFTLVAGESDDDNDKFTITGGKLYTAEELDFETDAVLGIRVRAEDGEGGSVEANLALNVFDVDEALPNTSPTAIGLSSLEVEENNAENSLVGTLTSTDSDTGDTHSYSLVDGDTEFFNINESELRASNSFDFESRTSYEITVRTTDAGGLIFDEVFEITVTDANEAPNELFLSTSDINENVDIGTVVGTLSTDDDDSGDTHTYSLDGVSAFAIDGSNLVTAEPLDFEDTDSFSFDIISTDAAGLTVLESVVVDIVDVNETPNSLIIDNGSINEAVAVGTSVGSFSVTDEDNGDSHTYAISGDDASSFVIVIDELRVAEEFDFESQASYSITVTATDAAGLSTSNPFEILVLDVNEAPTALELSSTSIDENVAVGTLLADITISDEDAGDTHTYSLSGADASSFGVASSQIELVEAVDFEIKSQFELTVTGTDSGGKSVSEDFTITISDVNEAPFNVVLDGNSIAEGEAANSSIGIISFDDFDAGDSHTLTVAGTDAALFFIENSELKNAEVLDHEANPSASISISVEDAGGLISTIEVSVSVSDVNEAPTEIALDGLTIDEGSQVGTTIGVITVSDEDANESFTYSITGEGADNFEIVNNELRNAVVFDVDDRETYLLTIEAEDQGGLSVSEEFTIEVEPVLALKLDESLLVYPNPSQGVFTIELPSNWQNIEWSLYDLVGREMQVLGEFDANSRKFVVDASKLHQGEYVLVIGNGEDQISRTVLIHK